MGIVLAQFATSVVFCHADAWFAVLSFLSKTQKTHSPENQNIFIMKNNATIYK